MSRSKYMEYNLFSRINNDMKVRIGRGVDDTQSETKEFNSVEEMLTYAFSLKNRIILHKLSKNPKDATYVTYTEGSPFDYFIMIYDDSVED